MSSVYEIFAGKIISNIYCIICGDQNIGCALLYRGAAVTPLIGSVRWTEKGVADLSPPLRFQRRLSFQVGGLTPAPTIAPAI